MSDIFRSGGQFEASPEFEIFNAVPAEHAEEAIGWYHLHLQTGIDLVEAKRLAIEEVVPLKFFKDLEDRL